MPSSSEKNSSPTYSNEVKNRFFPYPANAVYCFPSVANVVIYSMNKLSIGSFTPIVVCLYILLQQTIFGLTALQITRVTQSLGSLSSPANVNFRMQNAKQSAGNSVIRLINGDLMGRF